MHAPRRLFITANSPGEVAGWLTPLVHNARSIWPEVKISVILLPCTFASGSEQRVVQELPGVDKVYPAKQFFQLLLNGLKDLDPARHRGDYALLHLGGDLMYASALAWRWHLPAWSYLWGRFWWDSAFEGYFVKDQEGINWLKRHHISPRKGIVVGDLVADATRSALENYEKDLSKVSLPPLPSAQTLTFMPGSRPLELSNLAPFFLETAALLKQAVPQMEFQLMLSPFIAPETARQALQAHPHPQSGGLQGVLEGDILRPHQAVAGNPSIRIISRHNLAYLHASRMCISIPGTKTAEAACLGVPQMVLLPLNRPDLLPVIGILGLLDLVPGGKELKGRILLRLKKYFMQKYGFMAQPNIKAQRALVPELIDVITPRQVADYALQLWNSPTALQEQRAAFSDLYSPSLGAARKIWESIGKRLEELSRR